MGVARGLASGALALAATVMVMVCVMDDSTVRLQETPAYDEPQWLPGGQPGLGSAIKAAQAEGDPTDEFAEVDAGLYSPQDFRADLQGKEVNPEDADWEGTPLELLQKVDPIKDKFVQRIQKSFKNAGKSATFLNTQKKGSIHATIDFGDDVASHLSDKDKFPPELLKPAGLEKNCVTLRAYALAISGENSGERFSADLSKAGGGHSLNVLQNVLEGMGRKPKKGETCSQQYEAVMKPLRNRREWKVPNGIAKDMVKFIDHEMHSKRGILAFQSGHDLAVSGCLDKGETLQRAVECREKALARHSGQFVLIDASRVGWSGKPSIFADLAVRITTYLHALRVTGGKEEDVVQNKAKAERIAEIKVPEEQKKGLLKGYCAIRKDSKAKAATCKPKAHAQCEADVNCEWNQPWDGGLAEDDFIEH
jgi:hypothetical protein